MSQGSGGDVTFATPPGKPLDVKKIAQTATTITLGWTPVEGAAGYELWIDGKRQDSFSRDGNKSTWKIARKSGTHKYEVRPVVYWQGGSVTL